MTKSVLYSYIMDETQESREFWQEKEQETGKQILFKSFARFIGEAGKGLTNLSGLLYSTDDRVYFEDFEKTSFLDMLSKKKRNYEKFTMNFLLSEAASIRKVSENSAIACIHGETEEARPVSRLGSLFGSTAWEIRFNDGNTYFFELFETAKLKELINGN